MNITINPDGTIRFIHNDDLTDLIEQGEARITRASHVEPGSGGWYADMSPSLAPGLTPPMSEWMLGPFRTRGEALAAEVAWLETNRGL